MKKQFAIRAGLVVCALSSWTMAAPLTSASGLDGAGLGLLPDQNGRAWGEVAFHTQDQFTIVAPTFGVGFMPIKQLELNLVLPVSYVSFNDETATAFRVGDSATAIGNVYLGANYVTLDGPVRATVGLGIAAPTAPTDDESMIANVLGIVPHGYQNLALRMPNYLGVVVPFHVEGSGPIVGSLDGSLQLLFPTGDNSDDDSAQVITLAPGLGLDIESKAVLGIRVPMAFFLSGDEDDRAQITVEPFARLNVGRQGFLGVRFNMPVDEPLTNGDAWGLHLGGGAAF